MEGTSLVFSPSPALIQACETVAVEVRVNDVFDLYGVDIKVAFDPAVLEVVDANPAKPGIQVQDGGFLSPDFVVSREADNAAGTLEYAMTQVGGSPVSGSGVLFTIFFRAKATATDSALTFTLTDLVDLDGLLIWARVVQGSATTTAPAVPTLGILKLNATDVRLSWSAAPGVLGYELHRKPAPYFVPAARPIWPPARLPMMTWVRWEMWPRITITWSSRRAPAVSPACPRIGSGSLTSSLCPVYSEPPGPIHCKGSGKE